jgi:hypothetical protein
MVTRLIGRTISIPRLSFSRQLPEEGSKVMKYTRSYASQFVFLLALGAMLLLPATKLAAQQDSPPAGADADDNFNPPPCDYNDTFYMDNGLDPNNSSNVGRFGTFRQTGPPATGTRQNWVADSTCSNRDPNRRNFRILATTGGNADDGNSPFTNNTPETFEFISILSFVTSQNAFESTYSRNVGAINGGLDGDQQNAGTTISLTPGTDANGNQTGLNPRGISTEQIVSNFEAYAALKQTLPNGTFAGNPCAADMQSPLAPPTPCFPVNNVNTVFTPNLRQDWRFATNRNAMDGSDNNCINPAICSSIKDSPFGYFCDDLLGMWILTYFWFTQPPNTTDPVCGPIFKSIIAKNGANLDGTPILLTAFELNDEIEANGCGAEGQEAVDGSDGGAVWLVCPAIPDPRAGAIAPDAFLDQVRLSNGVPQNLNLLVNFLSLKLFGLFPNQLTAAQKSQLNSSVTAAAAPQ